MLDLDNPDISREEQRNLLGSFWTMLRECEGKADDDNDPMLKRWVEDWYAQWNRLTDDDKKPRWKK